MRIVGALLFIVGSAGTAFLTRAMFERKRPQDVLCAVLAPLAMLLALAGLVLVFVPDFFG